MREEIKAIVKGTLNITKCAQDRKLIYFAKELYLYSICVYMHVLCNVAA